MAEIHTNWRALDVDGMKDWLRNEGILDEVAEILKGI